MKVYNITDVVTPSLENKGQVNLPVTLGGVLIPPGEYREVPNKFRAEAARYTGALALDRLPPGYVGGVKVQPKKKPVQRLFTKKDRVPEKGEDLSPSKDG